MNVQDVYKFDERRIIAGKVESGVMRVGDEIIFSPGNKIVRVKSIEAWPDAQLQEVKAGMSVGITLSEQIFAERGQVISHVDSAPVLTNLLNARLFWLHNEALREGRRYKMKTGTAEYQVEVKSVNHVVDTTDLGQQGAHTEVSKNEVAEVTLRVRGIAALDDFSQLESCGRFVLVDKYRIVGGGIIDLDGVTDQRKYSRPKSSDIFPVDGSVTRAQRAISNDHRGGVLWFSGLSGSGKTTLALRLQQELFAKGYQVYILDGDNIRSGLCSDLGFEEGDRSENIRRVGEVAALFADAGVIVITAFISPYKEDRDCARVAAGEMFHSIYVKADIETCRKRDPKGLYKKADRGEIENFTGIDSVYEVPDNADLVLETERDNIEDCTWQLLEYVERNFSWDGEEEDYQGFGADI